VFQGEAEGSGRMRMLAAVESQKINVAKGNNVREWNEAIAYYS
jgi:hypothetical protein